MQQMLCRRHSGAAAAHMHVAVSHSDKAKQSAENITAAVQQYRCTADSTLAWAYPQGPACLRRAGRVSVGADAAGRSAIHAAVSQSPAAGRHCVCRAEHRRLRGETCTVSTRKLRCLALRLGHIGMQCHQLCLNMSSYLILSGPVAGAHANRNLASVVGSDCTLGRMPPCSLQAVNLSMMRSLRHSVSVWWCTATSGFGCKPGLQLWDRGAALHFQP